LLYLHKFFFFLFFILIDNNYNNSHIKQTEPSWNETVTSVNKINITFVHPSLLTENAYVSIYQHHENEYLLRQRYICAQPNCLIENNFTLSLIVENQLLTYLEQLITLKLMMILLNMKINFFLTLRI